MPIFPKDIFEEEVLEWRTKDQKRAERPIGSGDAVKNDRGNSDFGLHRRNTEVRISKREAYRYRDKKRSVGGRGKERRGRAGELD